MGSYEEYCFTIRPGDDTVESVAETLETITSLSEAEITPPQRIADDYWEDEPDYELDRLVVETNDGRACIGGRTHTPTTGDLWQWLLFDRLDCGGMVSLIKLAETNATAIGRLFEWDGDQYVDTTGGLGQGYENPLVEHSLAAGAVVADKIARETGMCPARKFGLDVHWYRDEDFVPVQYLREGGKPLYTDDAGRRCWWFDRDLSHRTDIRPVR